MSLTRVLIRSLLFFSHAYNDNHNRKNIFRQAVRPNKKKFVTIYRLKGRLEKIKIKVNFVEGYVNQLSHLLQQDSKYLYDKKLEKVIHSKVVLLGPLR
jgi:hypothetical protein